MAEKPGKGRVKNRIREQRARAGLTQQQLADAVGATRQTIVAIEAEKYAPSLELAFRIARRFGLPFEAVFTFDPE
jgi:putative transcriptional regulator